jgi:RecA-family ATPase
MFPTTRAAELEIRREEQRWLVEGLWSERACGIVGGEPKCGKSFLALEMAVAVAAGTPVLGRFPVPHPGPVLLYAAEDDLATVRERLASITRARGASLDTLDLHVITAPSVRLDHEADRKRLARTTAALHARLLVLDPLVRLHRIDENVVSEIAPILAYLRALERKFATSVLLVHHSRKAAAHIRAGQALRGSSELHAWGDSNLYLRRRHGTLCLGIEHRAAPAPDDLMLEIDPTPERTALRICQTPPVDDSDSRDADPRQRIENVLRNCQQPLSARHLREQCRLRTSTLCHILDEMVRDGSVTRSPHGFAIA